MTVDNQEPLHPLMTERSHDVGKHGALGVVAVVDAESEFTLTGVLSAQRHRGEHHGADAEAVTCDRGGINRYVMAEDCIGQIGQMQIMGLGSSPRQKRDVIGTVTDRSIIAHAKIYCLVHSPLCLC